MSSAVPLKIFKNAALLYILTFSNYFIGLLMFPYISRTLSVEGFGLIGFSMSYVLAFQVIVEFGFMISTTATISKHRSNLEKISEVISVTMYAKAILAIISILVFGLSAIFVPMVRDNILIVTLFLISSLLSAMLPDFFFRGLENMRTITIRTILIRTLSLILVILLVHNESQIILIPISSLIGNLVSLVVAVISMKKAGIRLRRVRVRQAIINIKESAMFFFSRLAVSINQSAGAFFIGLKFSPISIEAGVFAGATRISVASEMMLSPVSDSLYPHMVNKKDYRLFKKIVLAGGIMWFIVCSVIFIFANEICRIVLGPKYVAAGEFLRVLLFGNFMAFFSNMFGYNALAPIGKSNQANIALLISAIINIILYLILWITESINLLSVCIVIASTNFVIFGYRVFILWKNKQLIKQIHYEL